MLPLRLQALAAAGIGCFVDLTGAADPVPRYEPLPVAARAARRVSHPIGDFDVPGAAAMREVLDTLAAALQAGERVYLHCRAGIGRTGTVAGCLLVEHGFGGEEALALLPQVARRGQAGGRVAHARDRGPARVRPALAVALSAGASADNPAVTAAGRQRVVVGLSGGVDSAVAAWLLKRAGLGAAGPAYRILRR